MKVLKTSKGVKIYIYSNGKECPMDRYIQMQKWMCLESGIGSSIEAISSRFLKIKAFIEECKYNDALLENENAYKATISASEGVSYLSMAYACMVATIGGKACDDLSEEGLSHTVDILKKANVTYQDITDAVEEVKKKIDEELRQLYPSLHGTSDTLQYLTKMKVYILSVCDVYKDLNPNQSEIEDLNHQSNWFLINGGAKNFRVGDEENCLALIDKNFIGLCAMMEDNGSVNPKKYSVVEFYGKLDYIQNQSTTNVDG